MKASNYKKLNLGANPRFLMTLSEQLRSKSVTNRSQGGNIISFRQHNFENINPNFRKKFYSFMTKKQVKANK